MKRFLHQGIRTCRAIAALLPWTLLAVAFAGNCLAQQPETIKHYTATIQAEHPHDPHASTQGLAVYGPYLVESTGKYKQSTVRTVEPATGRVLRLAHLPDSRFGEGLTILNQAAYVLTWRSGQGYVFSLPDLDPDRAPDLEENPLELLLAGDFYVRGDKGEAEAWGLTHDGRYLIMSNGTDMLTWREPGTFRPVRSLRVHENGRPVRNINELEWINGRIWANIWKCASVAVINPKTGLVEAWVDLKPLLDRVRSSAGVANGLAYDAKNDRLFATGKLWEKLFEIRVPGLLP